MKVQTEDLGAGFSLRVEIDQMSNVEPAILDLIPDDACGEALEWLSGFEDPHAAIDECPQIKWLEFVIFDHADLGAQYERMRAPALSEWLRVRYQAWVEYERARDAVWSEYSRYGQRAEYARARVRNVAWSEWLRARDAAWAEYDRVRYVAARRVLHKWIENGAER